MRYVPLALLLGPLLLSTGCNSFPLARGHGAPSVASIPPEVPNKEAILAYLGDNAQRVKSLRCRELELTAKQGIQQVSVRGQLVCEKPRNFRLAANVLGKQEVDLGSNDREFWFWIARAEPPHLYHCAYQDLATGQVRLPFPFQPEWIMEALGIGECGPLENYELKVKPTTLELVEKTRAPQGFPVTKVTILHRGKAQGNQPQVTGYILYDAKGQEICSAQVSEVQQDRATGAMLPRKVKLSCPAEKMELKLQLDDLVVNDPTLPQTAGKVFARPAMTDVKSYDLARGLEPAQPGGNGVRRIGGQNGR